jgi:hypothetical protein
VKSHSSQTLYFFVLNYDSRRKFFKQRSQTALPHLEQCSDLLNLDYFFMHSKQCSEWILTTASTSKVYAKSSSSSTSASKNKFSTPASSPSRTALPHRSGWPELELPPSLSPSSSTSLNRIYYYDFETEPPPSEVYDIRSV